MMGSFDFKGAGDSSPQQQLLALEADATRGMVPRMLQRALARMKEVCAAAFYVHGFLLRAGL